MDASSVRSGSPEEIEILALIEEYAAAIDRGDLDGLADLFSDGVLRSPRGVAVGRDEVRRWYDDVILDESGSPGTWHHIFGASIRVEGGEASASSYVTVIQDGRAIVSGRYLDHFVRSSAGWSFAERDIRLDMIGDLSGHMNAVGQRPPRQP